MRQFLNCGMGDLSVLRNGGTERANISAPMWTTWAETSRALRPRSAKPWAMEGVAPQVLRRRYAEGLLVESGKTAGIGEAVLIGDLGHRPGAFAEGEGLPRRLEPRPTYRRRGRRVAEPPEPELQATDTAAGRI